MLLCRLRFFSGREGAAQIVPEAELHAARLSLEQMVQHNGWLSAQLNSAQLKVCVLHQHVPEAACVAGKPINGPA